jgi:hypothetical protein
MMVPKNRTKLLTTLLISLLAMVFLCAVTPLTEASVTPKAGTKINYGDGAFLTLNKTVSYSVVQRVNGVLNFSGCTLNLATGWNLVSFPFIPVNASLHNIFGATAYQAVTWNGTIYTTPSTASAGVAYWIFVFSNTTLHLSGIPLDTYTTTLSPGWNLKAGVLSSTTTVSNIFPNQVVSWNGTQYVSATSSTLKDSSGYWVLSLTTTTVTVR